MATTMNLIAKQTVGSGGVSSVTFSNIPQTFTDLKVVMSTRNNNASGSYFNISFNGVTTNRSNKRLYSNGSTVASYSGSDLFVYSDYVSRTANTFDNIEMYIPNYTSSNYKSISIDDVTENNASGAEMALLAGLWSSTAAITSISFTPDAGSFDQYTTFYLYGISNSSTQNTSVPLAYGGDVIATDGTYWYHAFKYSGSFTPLKNLTADVLVIAGGGGGGSDKGGGGGAGGLCYQAGRSLTANTSILCTVGAGGAGGVSGLQGTNGSNSIFDTITSIGGGGGGGDSAGSSANRAGKSGGSGGAPCRDGSLGTATQGNSGGATGYGNNAGSGNNGTGSIYAGGGGGGAGAVGPNSPTSGTTMASGGAGLNTWSSWASATSTGVSGYYAGGGGAGGYGSTDLTGGTGGSGGGGAAGSGNAGQAGQNAVVNTGSGGGGASNTVSVAGGAGGSGIIIVRYPV